MHTSVIELTAFGGLIRTPYNHLQMVRMSLISPVPLIRIKPGPVEPFVITMNPNALRFEWKKSVALYGSDERKYPSKSLSSN